MVEASRCLSRKCNTRGLVPNASNTQCSKPGSSIASRGCKIDEQRLIVRQGHLYSLVHNMRQSPTVRLCLIVVIMYCADILPLLSALQSISSTAFSCIWLEPTFHRTTAYSQPPLLQMVTIHRGPWNLPPASVLAWAQFPAMNGGWQLN